MFASKVAVMAHDLIIFLFFLFKEMLFRVLSPTCVASALVCGVEHLCVVVITLIIPAMGYYSSHQGRSILTRSEFKFQSKTRKLLSGIFNQ